MASLKSIPSKQPCLLDETSQTPIVHKTGLGSSAALVTSLSAALFSSFQNYLPSYLFNITNATDDDDDSKQEEEEEEKEEGGRSDKNNNILSIHRFAQIAHSLAQGKVY